MAAEICCALVSEQNDERYSLAFGGRNRTIARAAHHPHGRHGGQFRCSDDVVRQDHDDKKLKDNQFQRSHRDTSQAMLPNRRHRVRTPDSNQRAAELNGRCAANIVSRAESQIHDAVRRGSPDPNSTNSNEKQKRRHDKNRDQNAAGVRHVGEEAGHADAVLFGDCFHHEIGPVPDVRIGAHKH